MVRNRYAMMKRSSCEHEQVIVQAIDNLRSRTNRPLEGRAREYAQIVVNGFALSMPAVLYSSAAQRMLELTARQS